MDATMLFFGGDMNKLDNAKLKDQKSLPKHGKIVWELLTKT